MLSINEQIKKQIAQSIEGTKEAHGIDDVPLSARLQLIGNTLKLRIDIREWPFNVQVGKSISGMLSMDDCNVMLHSDGHCNSLTKILICIGTNDEESKTYIYARRKRSGIQIMETGFSDIGRVLNAAPEAAFIALRDTGGN